MRRTNSNGLKLDLTENTPGSSLSRLPNLVEHAETCQALSAGTGENLSSKLPNVVEGSMDYGSERRSSRYLEYQEIKSYQDLQSSASAVPAYEGTYHDQSRGYRNYDRKAGVGFERENLERYDNRIYPEDGLRYGADRRVDQHTYQESDLDAPYDRNDAQKLSRAYPELQDPSRRYSRDLTDYEYASRYAEETLKLEPKKDHHHHLHPGKIYEAAASKGYESGVKTHDSAYDLGTCAGQQEPPPRQYESKYHSVSKMYGTLPRYETSKSYEPTYESRPTFEPKYDEQSYECGGKTYEPKYELTSSKSYERGVKYESTSSSRYPDKSYDQTLKIGELGSSSSGAYVRKHQDQEETGAEKMNGYRKNNFEAYGVYSDPEDDHGFLADKKAPQYTYKGVVVNVSGESAVVDQKRAKDSRQTEVIRSPWCRPTILLLLLVLLVVIFVFVAGILLYFNYNDGDDDEDDDDGDTCRRYFKPERLLSPRQFYVSNLTCRARRDLPLAKLFGRNYNAASRWKADHCTNAQSSGDSCAARRPQLCLIAQRKIGRIVRESIDSLVSHSRRTADLKCLNALSQSSPASSSTLGRASRGRWSTGVAPIATAPDGAGHERVEEGTAKLDLSVIAKSRIELPCGTLDEIVSLPFAARTPIKLLRYCVSIFDIDISIKRLKKEQTAVRLILEMEVSILRN
ncbi:hypothetical protein ALC57_12979 [Trachymyrmex cornetzi]|uniref:Uncharacterized protein n=1 Tax=Trachymyrmex cornetzi TaxID=471704 RepID=A0A195DPM5_9HYME|nr:hypothetical protein ALC57_12979 [Trachymyrmex cornetzi]